MSNTINLLFAATSDYLPLITVASVSAKLNTKSDTNVNVYFLYADIVKNIDSVQRENIFDTAKYTFKKHGINFYAFDISEHIFLLKGQNIGMWGENISYTHYMYLLAPLVLEDIDKVIYIDADMIVNCDLSEVMDIDFGDKLIAMGAPRGMEEMGDDVSNSGFVVLNLKQWKAEQILTKLLEFGRTISGSRFCDQNLLYQYFTVRNSDRLLLLDKRYNIFPQLFPDIDIEDIKILHYTGWNSTVPWKDLSYKQRGSFLWWEYAKQTSFYEIFLANTNMYRKNINSICNKVNFTPLEQIFSIKNDSNKKHKIITFLGIHLKIKRK